MQLATAYGVLLAMAAMVDAVPTSGGLGPVSVKINKHIDKRFVEPITLPITKSRRPAVTRKRNIGELTGEVTDWNRDMQYNINVDVG